MAVGRGEEARGHVVFEEPIELSRYGAPLLRSVEPTSESWKRVNRHLFLPGCGPPRLNLVRSLVDTSGAPLSRRPQRR
jgi:hypothetical protein